MRDAISGNQWQSEAVPWRAHLMRDAISGNQWQSEAIRGNPMESALDCAA